jgi:FixJ family two-component response regulator
MIVSPARQRSRVSQLSDSERECLRLVLLHMTSKQIARRLGVSPHIPSSIAANVRERRSIESGLPIHAGLHLQPAS